MSNSINKARPESMAAPDGGLDSVVGYPAVVRRLFSIVVQPVTAAWAATPRVVAPSGVLLYGPPGDAAGQLRRALGRELDAPLLTVDLRAGVGVSPGDRSLVEVDGLDDFARPRGAPTTVLEDLFDRLEHIPPHRRPLVVATSVSPWHLEPRLLRAGRLDRLVFVPPPGWEARSAALDSGATRRGLDLAPRLSLLAAATVGWSGVDLDELLEQLSAEPIGRAIDREGGEADGVVGATSFLLDVVSRIVPRTRSWIGRAREMSEGTATDGMIDDLVAWLRRSE